MLSREVMDAPFLEAFKARLDGTLSNVAERLELDDHYMIQGFFDSVITRIVLFCRRL